MTQQPQPLADRIETAARTIRLRLGPNAISMAQRGEPIGLSGGEASDLAAAAMAVVQPELDQRDAEITRLRAELEQAQQQTADRIATEIRQYCPDHGEADTCRIDCHCAIADELDRPTAVSGA